MLVDRREWRREPGQAHAVKAGHAEIIRDSEAELSGDLDDTGREQVTLCRDSGRPGVGGTVEEDSRGGDASLDVGRRRLDHRRPTAGRRQEAASPFSGVDVLRPLEIGRPQLPTGRDRSHGHRHVPDAAVTQIAQMVHDLTLRAGLVDQHLMHPVVGRSPGAEHRDPAGREVVYHRSLGRTAHREHERVDREAGHDLHRPLRLVEGLGHEQHPGGYRVQLLREPVEHDDRVRVTKRLEQPPLDEHTDGPRPSAAERRRSGVRPGVPELGRRRPDPLRGGVGDRSTTAEHQGRGGRRNAGTFGDVPDRGPGRKIGLPSDHEPIVSNRFDSNRFDILEGDPVTATASGRLDQARLARARTAVYVVFAGNGCAFAAWASRIPDTKAQLGLTSGQLGLLLLALSAGAVIGLPSSGWIASWYGGSGAVRLGIGAILVGPAAIAIGIDVVDSVVPVAIGLFVMGLGMGIWDVGMNLEGAAVERLLGRSLMPRFHAAFSGGTVVSALVGAGLSWAEVPIGLHLVVATVIIAAMSWWATTAFLPRRLEEDSGAEDGAAVPGVLWAWRESRTILVGVLVLVAAFTEGTANDWLSVAMVEGYDLPPWAGVLGFATFLVFMTLGRAFGTILLDRYGRISVLRVLLTLAGVGSLLVVFGTTPLAYLGAAIWGVGVSLGFPVGMSAAADDADRAAARMSVVSTIGYTAFLAGPPLLGFLGDRVGILHALLAVGAGLIVALAVLPSVRERR